MLGILVEPCCASPKEDKPVCAEAAQVKTDIDWPAFLARHDMIWTKLPDGNSERNWTHS
jgi:hypothetical protein